MNSLKKKLEHYEKELVSFMKEQSEIEQKNINKIKLSFKNNPLGLLLSLYFERDDLQNAFPEVTKGDYLGIINWAAQVVSKKIDDVSFETLKNNSEWFLQELKKSKKLEESVKILEQKEKLITDLGKTRKDSATKIEELETARKDSSTKIEELETARKDSSTKIEELETARKDTEKKVEELESINIKEERKITTLQQENQNLKIREFSVTNELHTIKVGLPYLIARDVSSFLDKKFPPNSKLGILVRKIVFKKYKKLLSEQPKSPSLQFSYEYQFDDTLNKKLVDSISKSINYKPKISIVMPVYNSNISFLKKAIQSVKDQYYTNWQLCICDDGSVNEEVQKILREESSADERIFVFFKNNFSY